MPGLLAPQRERTLRKPTGLPNPPLILLTGADKSGKRYEAALGSASDLIGTTYWIGIGGSQGTADYYGAIPGVRYEIVEHDGSYQDILDAIRCAIAQPPVDGKRNMIVVDDVTALWDLLSDEQAMVARARASRRVQDSRGRLSLIDEPAVVDHGLWQDAKDRWGEVLWLLRRHSGPTLLIARQELITAYENDKPTRHTTRKIRAEKNLSATVDATVELRARGQAHLVGGRSLHTAIRPGESQPLPDFSVDKLLRYLGFEHAAPSRSANELRPEAYLGELARQPPAAVAQAPTAQPVEKRELTGEQAADIVRAALMDETDPVAALEEVRREWGRRSLVKIMTRTAVGVMNADELITQSLEYVTAKAKARAADQTGESEDGHADGEQNGHPESEPGTTTPPSSTPPSNCPPAPVEEASGQSPAAPEESAPPAPEEAIPPPPDPENPPPPIAESPEEVSAAEEPQYLPDPPARVQRKTKADRNAEKVREVLLAEAVVQARVLNVTVGEHLGSKSVAPMSALRDFLQEQRPRVVAALEEVGQTELAETYRAARIPELRIVQMFEDYLS